MVFDILPSYVSSRQKKNSIAQQHQIAARLREPFLDRSVTDSLRNNPAYAGFRLVCSEDPSILLPDDSTGYTEIELASRKVRWSSLVVHLQEHTVVHVY